MRLCQWLIHRQALGGKYYFELYTDAVSGKQSPHEHNFLPRRGADPSVLSLLIMSDSWSCMSNGTQCTVYFLNVTSIQRMHSWDYYRDRSDCFQSSPF